MRWEANAQAGRASLFAGEEQRLFNNFYFSTDQFLEYQAREEGSWAGLRALQGTEHLTPEAVHDFRRLLAEAKYWNWRILFLIHRSHQWSAVMKLTPENPGGLDSHDGNALWAGLCAPLAQALEAAKGDALIGGFGSPEDLP
jgi:hypothetical protein